MKSPEDLQGLSRLIREQPSHPPGSVSNAAHSVAVKTEIDEDIKTVSVEDVDIERRFSGRKDHRRMRNRLAQRAFHVRSKPSRMVVRLHPLLPIGNLMT
jgi:hypothetical protein